MNEWLLRWINFRMYRRFPEIAGVAPQVRRRPLPASRPALPTYRLTYRTTVTTRNGIPLQRVIIVVVNGLGRILRITTSR